MMALDYSWLCTYVRAEFCLLHSLCQPGTENYLVRNKFSVAEAIAWKCPGKFVTRPSAQADILRSRREKSVAVAWRSRTKLGLVTGYAQDYSYALTPEIYLEPYVYCSTSHRPIRDTYAQFKSGLRRQVAVKPAAVRDPPPRCMPQ